MKLLVGDGIEFKFPPTNVEEAKQFIRIFSGATFVLTSDSSLITIFSLFYLWKQTFAIPGSLILNVMAGALFGPIVAIPTCCLLTAIGSSLCYLWSGFIPISFLLVKSRKLAMAIDKFKATVEKKDSVLSLWIFLTSARIFPLTPHWLMNMMAPIVGIKLVPFFVTCFIGMIPYVAITTTAGTTFASAVSSAFSKDGEKFDPFTALSGRSFVILIIVSVALLLLGRILKKLEEKNNKVQ